MILPHIVWLYMTFLTFVHINVARFFIRKGYIFAIDRWRDGSSQSMGLCFIDWFLGRILIENEHVLEAFAMNSFSSPCFSFLKLNQKFQNGRKDSIRPNSLEQNICLFHATK